MEFYFIYYCLFLFYFYFFIFLGGGWGISEYFGWGITEVGYFIVLYCILYCIALVCRRMPGPTGTQSHELIPGYVTSLSCEFVSVSTGPADRKREWQRDSQQSPDDGRPSTSSQDSRRAKAKVG